MTISYNDWTSERIPTEAGKNILITGANSGLGLQAATVLSQKGANIIMGVRNLDKGKEAVAHIKSINPTAKLDLMRIDLSDLDSIRMFSQIFHDKYNTLNALMNNAGLMIPPKREITKQGFEIQFGTNHLGHFALTGLLLDIIKNTPDAVVATQSSMNHKGGDIHFEDLNWEQKYDKAKAYAQSKLANLLFTYELDRRFKAFRIDAIATASHPGYTETNLQRTSGFFITNIMNKILAQKVEIGALPIIRAATDKSLKGGEYIGPTGLMGTRGYPEIVRSNDKSYDVQLAGKLWDVSEKLTGVNYSF
jgi:NAD(P)-dependent dehydrogenase (short-subunit alcohol dehydrogenase family)